MLDSVRTVARESGVRAIRELRKMPAGGRAEVKQRVVALARDNDDGVGGDPAPDDLAHPRQPLDVRELWRWPNRFLSRALVVGEFEHEISATNLQIGRRRPNPIVQ